MWKNIEGTNYQVSDTGEVRNINTGRILGYDITVCGYRRVTLSVNGKAKKHHVHRLVAKAFIPNPENKPFVDHCNDIPWDNRVENLQWVTSSENNSKEHHRKALSEANTGKRFDEERKERMRAISKSFNWVRKDNPNARKVAEVNISENKSVVWDCIADAAEHHNVSVTCIVNRIKRGTIIKGTVWKYAS